jgi:hypothetical protein
MKEPTYYGMVRWAAEDIKTLRPSWSNERCEEELAKIEGHLQDRLVELGWEVIECLIPSTEDDMSSDDKFECETCHRVFDIEDSVGNGNKEMPALICDGCAERYYKQSPV